MFAGHVGAALANARLERQVNVGVFVAAALLLDIVLWVLVLLGVEAVSIPPHFASTHRADFVFPYSHGLVASVGWSALAGVPGVVWHAHRRPVHWRAAALIALAVFSHWLLDALVHQPELPLAGASSARVGLGLWHSMPAALAAEALIVAVGLWLFVSGSQLSRGRTLALAALTLLALVFTVIGMTLAPPPPSAQAMAVTSLITLVVVCALACWLGKRPRQTQGLPR